MNEYRQTETVVREKRYFSVVEANRTLPLVRRIVRDISDIYQQVLQTQNLVQQLRSDGRIEESENQRDVLVELLERLQSYADELTEIGAQLKDWQSGLIDFPAVHQGREILLCWRSGEDEILYWHELSEGYSGRQPIALLEKVGRK